MCFIIDVFSRIIVGWGVASHMRTETVLDAIEMARWSRGQQSPGLRCHSDAGRLHLGCLSGFPTPFGYALLDGSHGGVLE
jgi:transposase InsO family protein